MVIQRIQTLFLVIAVAFAVIFLFVPYGYADMVSADGVAARESLKAIMETGLWLPTAVSVALMVIAIFTFKKMAVQKLFVVFSALLTCACIISVVYVLASGYTDVTPGVTVAKTYWGGGGLIALAALICQIMAIRGISSDQKILKSCDSFR